MKTKSYRRNLELSYIVGALVYALNVIDASVDAHLYKFDINDNLTLKVAPVFYLCYKNPMPGLCFSMGFGKIKRTKT